MTSAKTYQWVLPHVFHAISRDAIRNFHTLFHTCCGNSHTVPHASTPYEHFPHPYLWSTFPHEFHTVWNMKKPWYPPTIT